HVAVPRGGALPPGAGAPRALGTPPERRDPGELPAGRTSRTRGDGGTASVGRRVVPPGAVLRDPDGHPGVPERVGTLGVRLLLGQQPGVDDLLPGRVVVPELLCGDPRPDDRLVARVAAVHGALRTGQQRDQGAVA